MVSSFSSSCAQELGQYIITEARKSSGSVVLKASTTENQGIRPEVVVTLTTLAEFATSSSFAGSCGSAPSDVWDGERIASGALAVRLRPGTDRPCHFDQSAHRPRGRLTLNSPALATLCSPGTKEQQEPSSSDLGWWQAGEGLANATEILLYALLILSGEACAQDTMSWCEKLLLERESALRQQRSWVPCSSAWRKVGGVYTCYQPLAAAVKRCMSGRDDLDRYRGPQLS